MKACRTLLLFIFLLPFLGKSQENRQLNAAEIKLGLQKLGVTGNVLYIAAHPDDENTRLLAYLAKEKKLRTGYLSMTRGDGGQNLIGTEQAELLGLIRTQELLAARKVDGAEQFFTRANDFGFSKTSDESLKFWGREQILSDVVWVIRNFKPDVIITRFPEDARAGHGQHAASAILAREAFSAAADAKRFPEQLKQVKPWKTTRLVWNTFNFNASNNTTSDDQLKLNVGLYNPLLGKSYGELAAESRTNHKSQGFGSAAQRGEFTEFFSHVAGTEAKQDLLEGINLDWSRFENGKLIAEQITRIEREFDASEPYRSLEALLKLKPLIDKTGIKYKSAEIDNLILACAGIWFELNTPDPQYAQGKRVPVRLQAIARVPKDFQHKITISESLSNQQNIALEPNKFISLNSEVILPASEISQPYWLESPHSLGAYNIKSQNLVGKPEDTAPFNGEFKITIGNQIISVSRPIVHKYTDQVQGEVYQNVVVAPPVTATLSDKAFLFVSNAPKVIRVTLQSFAENTSGTLIPKIPAGWTVSPQNLNFSFAKKGEIQTRELQVTPGNNAGDGTLALDIKVGATVYNSGITEIKYNHIPAQTLFPEAKALLKRIDLKTSGKKIAYLAGAGDLVAESMKQIGYEVTHLSAEQILNTNLSEFDALITGVRFYNVNEQAKLIQPKLLDYVANGGVLLVQYNVSNPLQIPNLGPYPFRLSRERVTEEDADVRILAPEHRLLNYPNKITTADFRDWVQERGLYFTTDQDKAYTTLLSMNDKGEQPANGSLIVAEHGKGRFVYTSLSFFRQLPAGVPGAYRLFVNLISR